MEYQTRKLSYKSRGVIIFLAFLGLVLTAFLFVVNFMTSTPLEKTIGALEFLGFIWTIAYSLSTYSKSKFYFISMQLMLAVLLAFEIMAVKEPLTTAYALPVAIFTALALICVFSIIFLWKKANLGRVMAILAMISFGAVAATITMLNVEFGDWVFGNPIQDSARVWALPILAVCVLSTYVARMKQKEISEGTIWQ